MLSDEGGLASLLGADESAAVDAVVSRGESTGIRGFHGVARAAGIVALYLVLAGGALLGIGLTLAYVTTAFPSGSPVIVVSWVVGVGAIAVLPRVLRRGVDRIVTALDARTSGAIPSVADSASGSKPPAHAEEVDPDLTREIEAVESLFTDVWTDGNIDRVDDLVAPECIAHSPVSDVIGQSGLERLVAELHAAFPDFEAKTDLIIATDDWIMVEATMDGTHEGEFMGEAPTGESISRSVLDVYRLSDGEIVEGWISADTLAVAQQRAVGTGADRLFDRTVS